jgi:flavin reductase (DIM6/NTAB) family NADH-FMN oxidoreductase RutF
MREAAGKGDTVSRGSCHDVSFDDLMGRLDHPMYVVTTTDGTRTAGCLVGFATQCSIDPPRFLACVSERNHTHRVVADASAVAVHLLRRDQHDLAALFGGETGDEVDKLARVAWTPGLDGVPVLDDVAASFDARILARHDLGDHTGLLLEPVTTYDSGAEVLAFDDVRDLEPGHEA